MPVALRRDPKVNVGALEGGEKVHELFLWGKRGLLGRVFLGDTDSLDPHTLTIKEGHRTIHPFGRDG